MSKFEYDDRNTVNTSLTRRGFVVGMGALLGTLAGITAGGALSPRLAEAAQLHDQTGGLATLSAASPVKINLPRVMQWAKDAQVTNVGINSAPAFAVFNNQLYCVHRGVGGGSQAPWYTVYDGFNWSKDTKINNVGISGTPALAVFNNRLYCVHQGIGRDSQTPWYTSFDGSSWSQDTKINNVGMGGSPALAVFNNRLYCIHQGIGGDRQVPWYTSFDGSSWSQDTRINNVGMGGAPALAAFNNHLYCIHQGIGGDSQTPWYLSFDGFSWSQDTKINNVGMGGAPALTVFNNRLYCVHQGIDRDSQAPWCLSFDGINWTKDARIDNVGISSAPALASIYSGLYFAHQGVDSGSQSLWVTHGTESSDLLFPIQTRFDLLDVWGEGRINDGGLITGFDQAYNLNKAGQTISNGPNRGQGIPDQIPVSEYANPTFPIGDGLVTYLTLMGAPITAKVAQEMERVFNKEIGLPTAFKRGMIILYDPNPNDLKTFENNTNNLVPIQNPRLDAPFNEITLGNIHVYKYYG